MLLHGAHLRAFALGLRDTWSTAPFPYEVALHQHTMTEVIEWCTQQWGAPANQLTEEGFSNHYKVYQELSWMWSPSDGGYLFFDDPARAVLAKLAWGGHRADDEHSD